MSPRWAGPGREWWWAITLGLTAVRAWVAAWLPLGDDEGYYWVWSRHLAAGYYDHPPLVAWLVALSTRALGVSLLSIRLPFVLCGTLTALALRSLVRETTGDRRLAASAALLLQIVPVFFALGFMVIPDGPLLLFWLLSARAAWRLRERPGPRSWLLLGLALGGAWLSKYVGVLVAFSLAGFELRQRRPRTIAGLAVSAAIAVLVLAPNLGWNATHHWASLRFQFLGRHEGAHVDPARMALFLASQCLYLSPVLLALLGAAAARAGPWGLPPAERGERFLWWLAAPTLAVFLAASAITDFKPNWPAPGYLTLIPLALRGLERWRTRALGRALGAAAALTAAFCVALPLLQAWRPIVPLPRGADPFADMMGWPSIAASAERAADGMRDRAGRPPFFAAGRYPLASRLEFHLRGHPEVVSLNPARDAYADWQERRALAGRNLVFVASDRFPAPPQVLARVDSARVFAQLVTVARGADRFTVVVYRAWGYRP